MTQSSPQSPPQSPVAPIAPGPIKRRFRWFRCFVILSCIAIVLFGILVYLAPTILSTDWVRGMVAEGLQENLRGPVLIEDIEVTWSRGVELRGLRIGNPPGFPEDAKAIEVERLHVDVDLSALIGDVFRFKLEVEEPKLFVHRRRDGAINLLELAEASGGSAARPSEGPDATGHRWPADYRRDYPNVLGNLEVDLDLSRGVVRVVDEALGVTRSIRGLEAYLGNKVPGKPVDLSIEGQLFGGQGSAEGSFSIVGKTHLTPGLPDSLRVETGGMDISTFEPILAALLPEPFEAFRGKVRGELSGKFFLPSLVLELGGDLRAEGVEIRGGPLGPGRGFEAERWRLKPGLSFDLPKRKLSLQDSDVDLGFAVLRSIPDSETSKRFGGSGADTTLVGLDIELDLARLAEQPGLLPEGSWGGKLRQQSYFAIGELPEFRIELRAENLVASLTRGARVPPSLGLSVEGKLVPAEDRLEGSYRISAEGLEASGKFRADPALELSLDGSLEDGSLARILEAWLPRGMTITGPTKVSGAVQQVGKDYQLNGTLHAPALRHLGNRLDDVVLRAAGATHDLAIKTVRPARLNGGPLELTLGYRPDGPDRTRRRLDFKLDWKGGRAAWGLTEILQYAVPLLAGLPTEDVKKLAGVDFDSIASLDLEGSGPLPSEEETLLTALDRWTMGGKLMLKDGSFTPSPRLAGLLRVFDQRGKLSFKDLSTKLTVHEGRVHSKSLRIGGGRGTVVLRGSTGLRRDLDYVIDFTEILRSHRDGARVLRAVGNKPVTARLGGTLTSPELRVEDLAKNILERGLENAFGEVMQGILEGQNPRKALKDLLDGLRGKKKR